VSATIPLDAPKPESYYRLDRADVVALLPRPLGAVLDVGCGEGGAAAPLRAAGASSITGIELLADRAVHAQRILDRVLVGDALECARSLKGPYDTILCYDVLEHLYDPLSVLMALRRLGAPGGHLHVSVPNASHISLLRDLIVGGTFGYAPYGHGDATHIRWFTRRDIVALVEEAGWLPCNTASSTLHWRSRLLARMSRGWTTEFLAGQWFVLARRP
jgi:2-polyprenyl-3-methyl-5-hydroxy-6-metoxy-1,4-benzoquinol methylase